MNKPLRAAAASLAALSLAGQALAHEVCARPQEAMALKTASVQQELMVAALTCGDTVAYNRFVLSHQSELQDSDAALKGYFHRASARGDDGYNAYKTALANDFSLESLHGQDAFCRMAEAAFGAAQGTRTLSDFIATQRAEGADGFRPCDTGGDGTMMVAGGSSEFHRTRR
ncbi:MAG TPA: hypothetical protein VMH86_09270 [Rhizomicrobium sp.]|nr:hypothetical protein [Rhizomicrobium sp.]